MIVPERAPDSLTTLERRLELLRAAGADDVLVIDFTLELASRTPAEFADQVLVGQLGAAEVVVGQNFRFGHRRGRRRGRAARAGRGARLRRHASRRCSSSTASRSRRRASASWSGSVTWRRGPHARRPPELEGDVVRGDGRGRELGVRPPTSAIGAGYVLPAEGVYAGDVVLADGRPIRSRHLGRHQPDVRGEREVRVEAHLLDFNGDLYGSALRLEFRRYLRGRRPVRPARRADRADARGHRGRRRMTSDLAARHPARVPADPVRVVGRRRRRGAAGRRRLGGRPRSSRPAARARLLVTDAQPARGRRAGRHRAPGAPTVIALRPLRRAVGRAASTSGRRRRSRRRCATDASTAAARRDDKGQVLPLIWAARELARGGRAAGQRARSWSTARRRSAARAPSTGCGPTTARPTPRSRSTRACPTRGRRSSSRPRAARCTLRIDVRTAEQRPPLGRRQHGAERRPRAAARCSRPCCPTPTAGCPTRSAPGRGAPSDAEREGWRRLPGGATDIAQLGGRPHDRRRRRRPLPAHRLRARHRRARHRDRRRAAGADADPGHRAGDAVDAPRARAGERGDVAGAGADADGRRRRPAPTSA